MQCRLWLIFLVRWSSMFGTLLVRRSSVVCEMVSTSITVFKCYSHPHLLPHHHHHHNHHQMCCCTPSVHPSPLLLCPSRLLFSIPIPMFISIPMFIPISITMSHPRASSILVSNLHSPTWQIMQQRGEGEG